MFDSDETFTFRLTFSFKANEDVYRGSYVLELVRISVAEQFTLTELFSKNVTFSVYCSDIYIYIIFFWGGGGAGGGGVWSVDRNSVWPLRRR